MSNNQKIMKALGDSHDLIRDAFSIVYQLRDLEGLEANPERDFPTDEIGEAVHELKELSIKFSELYQKHKKAYMQESDTIVIG